MISRKSPGGGKSRWPLVGYVGRLRQETVRIVPLLGRLPINDEVEGCPEVRDLGIPDRLVVSDVREIEGCLWSKRHTASMKTFTPILPLHFPPRWLCLIFGAT